MKYSVSYDYAKKNEEQQGVDCSSSAFQIYSGIDHLENKIINDDYIYISVSDLQVEMIRNGKLLPEDDYPGLGGYFTDEATVSQYYTKDGHYDAAGLADCLQQMPHYDNDKAAEAALKNEVYHPEYNRQLICLKIDREKLAELNHGNGQFAAAVGKCEKNDHLGRGGGNQGYNNFLTELYNRGCLTYDESRSRIGENTTCYDYDEKRNRAAMREVDCRESVQQNPALEGKNAVPSKEICEKTSMGPPNYVEAEPFHSTPIVRDGLHEKLNDPDLFKKSPGEIEYSENQFGKQAEGILGTSSGERNAYAQRKAGGAYRRETDDGGHLIGARFSGSPQKENLEAQDRNLNRGGYKQMENRWAEEQKAGNQIYAHVESFRSNGSERPDAFMGYTVMERPDGSRTWDAFSYQNESAETQQAWADALDRLDPDGTRYDTAPNAREYDPSQYADILTDYSYEARRGAKKRGSNSSEKPVEHQQDGNLLSQEGQETTKAENAMAEGPNGEQPQMESIAAPMARLTEQSDAAEKTAAEQETENQEDAGQAKEQGAADDETVSMDDVAGQSDAAEKTAAEQETENQETAGLAENEEAAAEETASLDDVAGQSDAAEKTAAEQETENQEDARQAK